MPAISLFVIIPEHVDSTNGNDAKNRIFISDASLDLNEKLEHANEQNEVSISVNGMFDLIVDDPTTIRREAQQTEPQVKDFVSLFSFLSCWPSAAVDFEW
jgi:hypothetical protein